MLSRLIELRDPLLQLMELAAPWGAEIAGCDRPGMYVVHAGALDLTPARLGTGDVLLLPSGGPHVLLHENGSQVVALSEFEKRIDRERDGIFARMSGPGPKTLFSAVPFAGSTAFPWLPRQIHVRGTELDRVARSLVDAYTQSLERGEGDVLARIAEALWLKIIAMRVPRVARFDADVLRAVACVLERPQERWNVSLLANSAGLSRSRFITRFTEALGDAPIRWVTGVRMRHADKLLRDGHLSVARVAEELGFGDESAFRKTFRRTIGRPARVTPTV